MKKSLIIAALAGSILSTPIAMAANQGLQAVIFDWAGTTVDYGSFAPLAAFQKVFSDAGVNISLNEARAPMGVDKRTHIERILQLKGINNEASVATRWKQKYGRDANQTDIDRLFSQFIPAQLDVINHHAKLIPGTLETTKYIKSKGWKIGSTTGYNSAMLEKVQKEAAKQGYKPDYNVASDMVSKARPGPNMIFKNCAYFNVAPNFVVKVDDTLPGIHEGLNAGAWTIMVLESGNALGVNENESKRMSQSEKSKRLAAARKEAENLAHFTVNSIQDVPAVLDKIDTLIKSGQYAYDWRNHQQKV